MIWFRNGTSNQWDNFFLSIIRSINKYPINKYLHFKQFSVFDFVIILSLSCFEDLKSTSSTYQQFLDTFFNMISHELHKIVHGSDKSQFKCVPFMSVSQM